MRISHICLLIFRGALGRATAKLATAKPAVSLGGIRSLSLSRPALGDYDWNLGVPGSLRLSPAHQTKIAKQKKQDYAKI